MKFDRLLAKSCKKSESVNESMTLFGHLRNSLAAVECLLDATIEAQLKAVGLNASFEDRLRKIVRIAAAVHDLGKLNCQFQEFIHAPWECAPQTLRHEWVTLLLLDGIDGKFTGWGEWLRGSVSSDEDWRIVRWIVSGHHPKYGRGAPPTAQDGPAKMILDRNHTDVHAIVSWLKSTFASTVSIDCSIVTLDLGFAGDKVVESIANKFFEDSDWWDQNLDKRELRCLVALAKNTLIAADVASSALPRQVANERDRSSWILKSLGQARLSEDDLKNIVSHHLAAKDIDPTDADISIRVKFQDGVAAVRQNVGLVTAGCGGGKTLAAYRWAEHHAKDKRLFICYPTTGTALEGFKDYLIDPKLEDFAKSIRSDLVTSRRELDLQIEGICESRSDAITRIESLDLWHRPLVACTWDAVLGVIQNNKRGMFGWPAIAQGAFVFDECHSADERLFDALLTFIETMRGCPILLMTASLPEARRSAIERVVANRGEKIAVPPGPIDLEIRKRYRLDRDVDWLKRIMTESAKGRVLVVLNTVERAMRLFDQFPDTALIYHSRFKYDDRRIRHDEVLKRIKRGGQGLAISTQVCEMSFNGDATLLVTELAPISALIQRLGRLNRFAKQNDPVRPFIVIEPGEGTTEKNSPLPYDADELEQARDWLKSLEGHNLSQQDLVDAWKPRQENFQQLRGESAWLDYGPLNTVLDLREGSPSITVIRDDDDYNGLKDGKKEIAQVVLSLPPPPHKSGDQAFEWQSIDQDGRPIDWRGIPIAREDAITYSSIRGAEWNLKENRKSESPKLSRKRLSKQKRETPTP